MNRISVTCAIIEQDGKILCAQRSTKMKHPLKWEFPGGKLEEAESFETCLQREIWEELGIEIKLLERLPSNFHIYSNFELELIPFRCSLQTFEIDLLEHSQILWLSVKELKDLDWAEADIPIVNFYTENYK
ncbi:(deoxy)nucleoside triphosphate pyrophosphohydrolase [Antarcticibacterium sp. 1MA-6-2]|uniref:(deoxy)nucleoside triphosphate pyrophosphohydrolase n=1 Tax=Antarcticibacterium sp. 1MA-6-2 TaxID=2908210 RepID=UPI001F37FD5F|nr:(deoxy)nucleoside triphosphate pyrophosphohydrolase [Antarcticibacterium sp. 1MA-6-2]UJH90392.1 (deoxy)nucleoside triphosphate pyrophosphohydrolase [Antarcticibacterium sp. 1MA-6-2]